MKYIKRFKDLPSAVGLTVNNPGLISIIGTGISIKKSKTTDLLVVSSTGKLVEDSGGKKTLKFSANGDGQIALNKGYCNSDRFLLEAAGVNLIYDPEKNCVFDDTLYYGYIFEYNTFYIPIDIQLYETNDTVSTQLYVAISENEVAPVDGAEYELIVFRKQDNYTGAC